MKPNHSYLKKRQLKALAEKLHDRCTSHRADVKAEIDRLIQKIKLLVHELSHVLSRADLKKILGATAVLIGISFPSNSNAQSFASPVENPFGLVPASYIAIPAFADLDNDGDYDLLVGEYYGGLKFYQNSGTSVNPEFSTPVENAFGIPPNATFAIPAFADIDGDSDLDLFVGSYFGQLTFYENTGTISNPDFATSIANPFGFVPTYTIAAPAFADLDDDGDLDLLVGEDMGAMKFFLNTGSATEPQFAAPIVNPFNLESTYYLAIPAFADVDGDGDFDLLVGEYYGGMEYFQNTGTASLPLFAPPVTNPSGLVSTYYNAFPAFADLDADGDMDLLVGEYYGVMQYFENLLDATAVHDGSTSLNLSLFPNPVSDLLRIECDESIQRVEIFHILGGHIITYERPESSVSLSHLSPGTYSVKITSDKGSVATKILQKHK